MKTIVRTAFFALLLLNVIPAKAQQSETAAMLTQLLGDEQIVLPDAFRFDKSIEIKIKTEKKDVHSRKINYLLRFSDHSDYLSMDLLKKSGRMPVDDSELVIDFSGMEMISFLTTPSAKMAVILPLEDTFITDIASLENTYQNLSKTDRSKSICGYPALEYTFESPELKGSLWLSSELELGISKNLDAVGLKINPDGTNSPGGVIMALESVNKNTGEQTQIEIEDLKLSDTHEIPTAGYIPTRLPQPAEVSEE